MSKEKQNTKKTTTTSQTPKTSVLKNDTEQDLRDIKELLARIAVSLDKLYDILPFKK